MVKLAIACFLTLSKLIYKPMLHNWNIYTCTFQNDEGKQTICVWRWSPRLRGEFSLPLQSSPSNAKAHKNMPRLIQFLTAVNITWAYRYPWQLNALVKTFERFPSQIRLAALLYGHMGTDFCSQALVFGLLYWTRPQWHHHSVGVAEEGERRLLCSSRHEQINETRISEWKAERTIANCLGQQ